MARIQRTRRAFFLAKNASLLLLHSAQRYLQEVFLSRLPRRAGPGSPWGPRSNFCPKTSCERRSGAPVDFAVHSILSQWVLNMVAAGYEPATIRFAACASGRFAVGPPRTCLLRGLSFGPLGGHANIRRSRGHQYYPARGSAPPRLPRPRPALRSIPRLRQYSPLPRSPVQPPSGLLRLRDCPLRSLSFGTFRGSASVASSGVVSTTAARASAPPYLRRRGGGGAVAVLGWSRV